MSIHRQRFQRKNSPLILVSHWKFPPLLHFPDGNRQQICLPIRMSSQPGPGMIDVMVCHQDLGPLTVNHPGRRSHMRHGIVPCKYIPFFPQAPEKDVPVPFLLFIKRDGIVLIVQAVPLPFLLAVSNIIPNAFWYPCCSLPVKGVCMGSHGCMETRLLTIYHDFCPDTWPCLLFLIKIRLYGGNTNKS